MNKNKILQFVFLMLNMALIAGNQSVDSIDNSNSEKELRNVVIKIWEDAENQNLEELRSAHLNSPKFSKFGPRIAKRQDVTSTNQTETEHFSSISDISLEIEDLKIDIFGDVGVATLYNNFSFIKNDNKQQGKVRVTLVFLQTDDGWKIIHEHSSPFTP